MPSKSPKPQVTPAAAGCRADASGSAIEWAAMHHQPALIRGWLRGHPETTLFLIHICADLPDRGTMTGAFIPDAHEGRGHLNRALLPFLKVVAEIYLEEFLELLSGVIETPNESSAGAAASDAPSSLAPPPSLAASLFAPCDGCANIETCRKIGCVGKELEETL